ncbi:hypothetical protein [Nocardia yunnanensis]|nr:hypothetical protein [Nocardia yunnanensis]
MKTRLGSMLTLLAVAAAILLLRGIRGAAQENRSPLEVPAG